jgi:hypothetical protein
LATHRKFQQTKKGIASGKRLPITERMERVQAEMHSLPPVPAGKQSTPASDACEVLVERCLELVAAYAPILEVGYRYEEVQRG